MDIKRHLPRRNTTAVPIRQIAVHHKAISRLCSKPRQYEIGKQGNLYAQRNKQRKRLRQETKSEIKERCDDLSHYEDTHGEQ